MQDAVAVFYDDVCVDIRIERRLRTGEGNPSNHRNLVLDRLSPAWRKGTLAPDADFPPSDIVWFDLETTGLGGGAGVRAFLAGIVREEADGILNLIQHVLPDFDRGAGYLAEVDRDLGSSGWITYNGRTFDMPLWNDLHVMARRRPPQVVGDMDLLPVARSIWKARLPNLSLSTVADAVLDEPDVFDEALGGSGGADPGGGAMPELYLAFLGSGDPDWLRPALFHNGRDLLHLHALTRTVARALIEPPGDWVTPDLLGLARLATRWRLPSRPALEAALQAATSSAVRARARSALGFHDKRHGRYSEAADQWWQAVRDSNVPSLADLAELAKYLEHRVRDYARALALAERALRICRLAGTDVRERDIAAWEHRRARLRRKLAKASGPGTHGAVDERGAL